MYFIFVVDNFTNHFIVILYYYATEAAQTQCIHTQ